MTPGIIRRLKEVGDPETIAILETILAEEVGHVAIGTRWFHWLCAQRGVDPAATSAQLLAEQGMNIRPPINEPARLAAGFSTEELAAIRASFAA